jgi:hypothetical protein
MKRCAENRGVRRCSIEIRAERKEGIISPSVFIIVILEMVKLITRNQVQ